MTAGGAKGDGLRRRESKGGVGSRTGRVLSPDMHLLYGRFLEVAPAKGCVMTAGGGEGGGL